MIEWHNAPNVCTELEDSHTAQLKKKKKNLLHDVLLLLMSIALLSIAQVSEATVTDLESCP